MRTKFKGLVVLVLVWAGSQASAETVAMVTDISGLAQRGDEGLAILSDLNTGDIVAVSDSAVIHVVYYADAKEFVYFGPAEFEVGPAQPRTLAGNEPNSKSMMPEGEGSISTVGLAQAAMVMRAAPSEARLELLFPVETTLLEAPTTFSWDALEPDIGYAFELTDGEGRAMMESIVNGTEVALPDHVQLAPGEYYTWSLETRLADGRKFSSWASFSIATQDLKDRVNRARPAESATVSELVVFALWLEQNEFLAEARRFWKKAESMRPGDESLKSRLN